MHLPDTAHKPGSSGAKHLISREESLLLPNATWRPQSLWSLSEARGQPLDVRIRSEEDRDGEGGPVRVRELYYTSHRWQDAPVRIAGHLAIPVRDHPLPGFLLGSGSLESAESFARGHNVVCMAFDRPGVGDSNGPADVYENWINLDNDPRDGWMWHYVQAALRAITYLTSLPCVTGRIGIAGSSRGGTMAWIVNGLDPRVALCIAQATSGDILLALEHDGWANYIYRDEQGNVGIPRVFRDVFARYGDPIQYAERQHGVVFQILGAQDEFFPIYTVKTTAEAMPAARHLLELIPDWDHGLFSRDDPNAGTYDNSAEANRRISACIGYAVDAYLHGRRPALSRPTLTIRPTTGDCLASVDESLPVCAVLLHHSADGAWLFDRQPMSRQADGWAARLDLPPTDRARAAIYAEVEYEGGPFLSSVPQFGEAFAQRMRAMPEPAPTEFVVEDIPYHSTIDDLGPLYATVAYDRLLKGAPLLVLMHGGYPGSRETMRPDAERLARCGLFVVAPSIRGRDGSAGEPDLLARECHDVRDVVNAVRSRFGDLIDPEHVSIVGYSAGGALALASAVRFPDLFRAVVAFFARGRAVWGRRLGGWRPEERPGQAADAKPDLAERIIRLLGGMPDEVPGRYAVRDVHSAIENLRHCRVLLFHDAEDAVLSCEESEALYQAARRLGLRNVSFWRSEPGDGRRWLHAHPSACADVAAAEHKFIPAIVGRRWPAPDLPDRAELIVAGYVITRGFAVWLGDGTAARGRLRYQIGEGAASFELREVVGALTGWTVTWRGQTRAVSGDAATVRL
jgi:dienelactone hydrolase